MQREGYQNANRTSENKYENMRSGWPAFWKSEGFRNRVVFRKEYQLEGATTFCVYSRAIGYVLAGERKYPFGKKIT